MHDACGVRVLQRLRDGQEARRRQLRRVEGMPLGEGAQGLAADELGDEVAGLRLRAAEVVDVEDVRMVQARHRVRLAVEAAADLLARVEMGVQHLHGHDAAQLGVPASPDHGHAALTDLLFEPVPAQLHRTSVALTRVSRSTAKHALTPFGKRRTSASGGAAPCPDPLEQFLQ